MPQEKASIGQSQPSGPESPDMKTGIEEDAHDSTSSNSSDDKSNTKFNRMRNNAVAKKCWALVTWTPERCRWHLDAPPRFSMALNLLFGFVSVLLCLRKNFLRFQQIQELGHDL